MGSVRRFYVYGITVNDVVKYVGKGSETDRQDRVSQYFTHDLKHATPSVRDGIQEARARGDSVGMLILEEFPVPVGASESFVLEVEDRAYKAEALWVDRYGLENLWNRVGGGKAGWKLGSATKKLISISRKKGGRFVDDPEGKSRLGRLLTAVDKIKAQHRPKGESWSVSVKEAKDLNLPAGKVELTDDQVKELRNYRYKHARILNP